MTKEQALAEIERLKEYVASQPEEVTKPELGKEYWFVSAVGKPLQDLWVNNDADNARLAIGNCFWGEGAKERCEARAWRIRNMGHGWTPEVGKKYWVWNILDNNALPYHFIGIAWDWVHYHTGALQPTKELCEAWGKEQTWGKQ